MLIAAVLAFQAAIANAAPQRKSAPNASVLKEKKGDLGELRQRIEQLKKEMGTAESARSEVADQLKEQERAISDLQRELFELAAQREVLRRRIRDLDAETRLAESHLNSQQTQIERLLAQHYMTGTPGPLQLLLSGNNANQMARDLTYLGLIGQARQGLARQTAILIDEKKQLADRAEHESAALETLEARQRTQQEKMLARREERKKTLVQIATRLDLQRREIDTLKRDEQRLARLVDRLSKLIASRPKPGKPPRVATAKGKPDKHRVGANSSDPAGTNAKVPTDAESGAPTGDEPETFSDLARRKGRLPFPADGPLGQRFGASLDGGVRSKGIFVRAANGSPVRAVAAGQVVFADWMRGFGNLLVLDHGYGFLSIYGYNEAVLRQVGDRVRGNETIATTGSSGGRSETGLYFELRRKGEPLDPGQWLRR